MFCVVLCEGGGGGQEKEEEKEEEIVFTVQNSDHR
jgi:hypothetical protein